MATCIVAWTLMATAVVIHGARFVAAPDGRMHDRESPDAPRFVVAPDGATTDRDAMDQGGFDQSAEINELLTEEPLQPLYIDPDGFDPEGHIARCEQCGEEDNLLGLASFWRHIQGEMFHEPVCADCWPYMQPCLVVRIPKPPMDVSSSSSSSSE